MPYVSCSVCKDLVLINYSRRFTDCNCAFHDFCLNLGFHSKKKITRTCDASNCLSHRWFVTQKQMDNHIADFDKLENGLREILENVRPLKLQLSESEDIVEQLVELINQLDSKAYNSFKQHKLVDNLKEFANSSNKHHTLQEVNVATQENKPSPLNECGNNLERLNNELKTVEEISPCCKCAFEFTNQHSKFTSAYKYEQSCSATDCLGRYWMVRQEHMDEHKALLNKLKNQLWKNLENLGPLKIQLRQSEEIVEQMLALINQLDPNAFNSIKQQRLVDILKKVANSSNKHQTLQEVNAAEQKSLLSSRDECANNLESLMNNEQKSIEETKILNNTPTTTNICILEEHQTTHASDIENLHVEKTQMNQQSSENLKELNDKINSTEEQKRFDEFMNIVENIEKKMSLLLERLDLIEKNVESLTPAEVNFKNSGEQQEQRENQLQNIDSIIE